MVWPLDSKNFRNFWRSSEVFIVVFQNGFQTALGDFFPNFATHLQRQTETAFGQAAHGGKMRAGNAVGNVKEIAFFTILQGRADR